MYNQGRCSAHKTAVIAVAFLLCLVFHLETTEAKGTTFTVGDSSGWSFSIGNWTKGKNFKADDILGNIKKQKKKEPLHIYLVG